jgi:gamma-glutamyltranspeptidase / glutathione hydrolase
VSLIQSNFVGFGSGVVVPGTGIGLHDRGAHFSLDPGDPNVIGPGQAADAHADPRPRAA